MCSSVFSKKVSTIQVETNISQGSYRPPFFDLPEFNIKRAEFNSLFFNKEDVEKHLLQGQFSFTYLREDKLRVIDAFNTNGEHIQFKNFLQHFGINTKIEKLIQNRQVLIPGVSPYKVRFLLQGVRCPYQ